MESLKQGDNLFHTYLDKVIDYLTFPFSFSFAPGFLAWDPVSLVDWSSPALVDLFCPAVSAVEDWK